MEHFCDIFRSRHIASNCVKLSILRISLKSFSFFNVVWAISISSLNLSTDEPHILSWVVSILKLQCLAYKIISDSNWYSNSRTWTYVVLSVLSKVIAVNLNLIGTVHSTDVVDAEATVVDGNVAVSAGTIVFVNDSLVGSYWMHRWYFSCAVTTMTHCTIKTIKGLSSKVITITLSFIISSHISHSKCLLRMIRPNCPFLK